jgi:hypothetical protein
VRRRFHYLMTGVYLWVAAFCALSVATHVISEKLTWEELWWLFFGIGGLINTQEALGWARSLNAEDESGVRG